MEVWVVAAQRWSEASQELVGAAAGLALISRTLDDELHLDRVALSEPVRRERAVLGDELAMLANKIEDESASLRNAYLETAARMDAYDDLLG
ncbi:MAG TPA: hypothetical protein VID76_03155 [Solirubrobacterales bacterium]